MNSGKLDAALASDQLESAEAPSQLYETEITQPKDILTLRRSTVDEASPSNCRSVNFNRAQSSPMRSEQKVSHQLLNLVGAGKPVLESKAGNNTGTQSRAIMLPTASPSVGPPDGLQAKRQSDMAAQSELALHLPATPQKRDALKIRVDVGDSNRSSKLKMLVPKRSPARALDRAELLRGAVIVSEHDPSKTDTQASIARGKRDQQNSDNMETLKIGSNASNAAFFRRMSRERPYSREDVQRIDNQKKMLTAISGA